MAFIQINLGPACVSVRDRELSRLRTQRAVAFRPTVTEELPHFADLCNHLKVKVGHYDFIFVAAGLRDYFSARIAEVALAIKLANTPRLFDTHAIDGSDKIAICNGMRRLLEFPQIFGEPRYRRRRVED